MARFRIAFVLTSLTAAFAALARSALAFVDRCVSFALALVPADARTVLDLNGIGRAPLVAGPSGGIDSATFNSLRHEAGASRRAAARHI